MQPDILFKNKKVKFAIYILITCLGFSLFSTAIMLLAAPREELRETAENIENIENIESIDNLDNGIIDFMDYSFYQESLYEDFNEVNVFEDIRLDVDDVGTVDDKEEEKIIVNIPQGISGITVGEILEEKGLIKKGDFRKLLIRFEFGNKIKAGSYEFSSEDTIVDILDQILID